MIPNPQSIHKIGTSLKTHGKEGHIRLDIDTEYLDDLSKARALFFDLEGSRVPFLIEELKLSNHVLIKLDEVDSPEKALLLQQKSVYLHDSELSEVPVVMSTQVDMLVGYNVLDQNGSGKGKIIGLEEYPHQLIATISSQGQEFLLPLHEDMIIQLDESNKCIHLEWPDGIENI